MFCLSFFGNQPLVFFSRCCLDSAQLTLRLATLLRPTSPWAARSERCRSKSWGRARRLRISMKKIIEWMNRKMAQTYKPVSDVQCEKTSGSSDVIRLSSKCLYYFYLFLFSFLGSVYTSTRIDKPMARPTDRTYKVRSIPMVWKMLGGSDVMLFELR